MGTCATIFGVRVGRGFPLPGLPGSDEFISAYRAALDGKASAPRGRGTPAAVGTFNRLALEYFASPDFLFALDRERGTPIVL